MSNEHPTGNGWVEWKNKVLSDLDVLTRRIDRAMTDIGQLGTDVAILKDVRADVQRLTDAVNELREDIAVIKTKLATYGAGGGAVAGIAISIITALIMGALNL